MIPTCLGIVTADSAEHGDAASKAFEHVLCSRLDALLQLVPNCCNLTV